MQSENEKTCLVCLQECKERTMDYDREMHRISCERCGRFDIFEGAELGLEQAKAKHLLSGAIREKSETSREVPQILEGDLSILIENAPSDFDVPRKARKLLAAVARRSRFAGDGIRISDSVDLSLAYARNIAEFIYLSNYAADQGWLNKELYDKELAREEQSKKGGASRPWVYTLTPKGWEELQRRLTIDSSTVFVAMWFDKSLYAAYQEGIRPAVEEDSNWRAIRVDLEEHNQDIVDKILGEIRESKFVIVDVTGHRNGVYFEAGFALGLGVEVIWTCQKTEFDDKKKRTFDTEHYPHVVWKTPEDLRTKLSRRILAVVGRGTYQPLDKK